MCCCQTFDLAALSHMHMHGGCRVNPIRASGKCLPWQDVAGEGAGLGLGLDDWTTGPRRQPTRDWVFAAKVAGWPLAGAWCWGTTPHSVSVDAHGGVLGGAVARVGVGCPFGLVESRCTSAKEVRAEGWVARAGWSQCLDPTAHAGRQSRLWCTWWPCTHAWSLALATVKGLPGSGHASLGPIGAGRGLWPVHSLRIAAST